MRLAIDQLIQGLMDNFSKAFQSYTELIESHKHAIE